MVVRLVILMTIAVITPLTDNNDADACAGDGMDCDVVVEYGVVGYDVVGGGDDDDAGDADGYDSYYDGAADTTAYITSVDVTGYYDDDDEHNG